MSSVELQRSRFGSQRLDLTSAASLFQPYGRQTGMLFTVNSSVRITILLCHYYNSVFSWLVVFTYICKSVHMIIT